VGLRCKARESGRAFFLRRNGYRNRREFSDKAKVRQALEQTFCLLLLRTAVEVVWAEVLVLSALL